MVKSTLQRTGIWFPAPSLKTATNLSSWGYDTLFWPLRSPAHKCISQTQHTHTYTQINKYMWLLKKKNLSGHVVSRPALSDTVTPSRAPHETLLLPFPTKLLFHRAPAMVARGHRTQTPPYTWAFPQCSLPRRFFPFCLMMITIKHPPFYDLKGETRESVSLLHTHDLITPVTQSDVPYILVN